MRWIAVAIVVLLAACQTDETRHGRQADACVRSGGVLVPAGIEGGHICERPVEDAGQSCATDTDCSGYCLAETRQCSPTLTMSGCFDFLDARGETVSICID
jgi:hypothetical protein